jgi:hypothetical protein
MRAEFTVTDGIVGDFRTISCAAADERFGARRALDVASH